MGEKWGLSVKLFGKTIMVVPTSKGGDTASGVCAEPGGRSFGGEADELIKDENSIASSSPVTKSTETEEETGGNRDSESPEPEAKTRSEGNEEVEEQVQVQPQREDKQKMDEGESQKKETAVIVVAEAEEEGNGEGMATEEKDGKKKPEKPDKNKILPCPRCKSQDTKFCYYNNYNVNQPRHFCRNCQRYWTAGGSMRNVPVGAGRRKSKSAVAEAANVNNSLYIFMLRQHQQQQQQQQSFMTAEAAALHQRSVSNNRASTVLSFSHNNSVARVAPIGNGSSPAQRDGMVLVYSPAAATSTTTTTTAAATKNHISPSYYNAFTYDQTKREPYYHGDQGKINETNPPVHPINAIKYMPWTLPPTYLAEPVPVWQQPMQLGKHTRDHTDNNLGVDLKQRQYEDDEEHSNTRVWVPKALRITDTPDAAANSSIWTTISASGLGCNKKEHHNLCAKKMGSSSATMERGFFNAFHAKEAPVSTTVTTTNTGANDNRGAILFANPAALARSHQFEETV